MTTSLPEGIDARFKDRSQGDRAHQQAHDEIHRRLNRGLLSNPAVEGQPLTAYGASGEAANIMNRGAGTNWLNRTARRLGLTLVNRALSGSEAADNYFRMTTPGTSWYLTPNTKGIVLISTALNDIVRDVTTLADLRVSSYKETVRAMLWFAMCESVQRSPDASGVLFEGTWTTLSGTFNAALGAGMNFSVKQTNVAGSRAVFTTPVARDLVFFGMQHTNVESGKMDISVDGTLKYDDVVTKGMRQAQWTSGTNASGQAFPLLDLPVSAHQVEIVARAGNGNNLTSVDQVGLIDRDELPQIVLYKFGHLDYARPYVAGLTPEHVQRFRTAVDEVVAETIAAFPPAEAAITVVDPLEYGWDASKMIGSDRLHVNDLWQAVMAEMLTTELMTLGFRNGLVRL